MFAGESLGRCKQVRISDVRNFFAVLWAAPVDTKRVGEATAEELVEVLSGADGSCPISVWARIVQTESSCREPCKVSVQECREFRMIWSLTNA
jgi:hypothetical protein